MTVWSSASCPVPGLPDRGLQRDDLLSLRSTSSRLWASPPGWSSTTPTVCAPRFRCVQPLPQGRRYSGDFTSVVLGAAVAASPPADTATPGSGLRSACRAPTPLACGASTTGALSASNRVPLLRARRRHGERHAAAPLHPHQPRTSQPQMEVVRSRGRAHRRQFRRHPEGRHRRPTIWWSIGPATSLTVRPALYSVAQPAAQPSSCSPVSLTCGQTHACGRVRSARTTGHLRLQRRWAATESLRPPGRAHRRLSARSSEMYDPPARAAPPDQYQRPAATRGAICRRRLHCLRLAIGSALNLGSYRVSLAGRYQRAAP